MGAVKVLGMGGWGEVTVWWGWVQFWGWRTEEREKTGEGLRFGGEEEGEKYGFGVVGKEWRGYGSEQKGGRREKKREQ
ncbi:uncharacterized protein G2W53_026359 [Senna tora]|uniref:Uncharacterized protein n=1 Tax=Senna tora TaxID=362788 RepID=A0A834TNR2_9FABA|nr:uncharacterized protein G2W53_026359 [Senna tora]